MKEYLDNIKNFEDTHAKNALNAYIEHNNTTRKESTKYKPIEITDLDDPILIDKILSNILKSFKRHIINNEEIIDINEKLLLWNNIIRIRDFYIKNNKDKKGSFTIPCI